MKFSEWVAETIKERVEEAPPGAFLRLKLSQLGFPPGNERARDFARDVAVELGAAPTKTLYQEGMPETDLYRFSTGAGCEAVLAYATKTDGVDSDGLLVDIGFAARLRDARVEPSSEIFNNTLIFFVDEELDTLLASTDLTARGEALSPERLLERLEEACESTKAKTFLRACAQQLHTAIFRGGAAERNRILSRLIDLSSEPNPDIGRLLPQLGPWMPDADFDEFLREKSETAAKKRLALNESAARVVEEARSGKDDPVSVLEKVIDEGKVAKWAKKVENADLDFSEWDKDRRTTRKPRVMWDRFRFQKANVVTRYDDTARSEREVDAIVFRPDGLKVTALYKELPEKPPIEVLRDGEVVEQRKAGSAGGDYTQSTSEGVEFRIPPPGESWVAYELRVYAGKQRSSGTPHAVFRALVAPKDATPFYLPKFTVDTASTSLRVTSGRDLVVAETEEQFRRQQGAFELPELFGPAEDVALPARILSGPENPETWRFRTGDGVVAVPIQCQPSGDETDDEAQGDVPFLSAIHLKLAVPDSPDRWVYLRANKAITSADRRRARNLGLLNVELSQEDELVRNRMYSARLNAEGELTPLDPPGRILGSPKLARVMEAYSALFGYYERHETLPSLLVPDAEYRTLVQEVLDSISAVLADERLPQPVYQWIWRLGIITDSQDALNAASPLWPPCLAYAIGLDDARRAGTIPKNRLRMFTPAAIVPCSLVSASGSNRRVIPRAAPLGLWLYWDPLDVARDATVRPIHHVISERLENFTQAFPALTGYHEDAPLLVNFIGIQPDKNVASGLRTFLSNMIERDVPQRVRAQFFLENPENPTQLEDAVASDDRSRALGGEDPLRSHLTFAKRHIARITSGEDTAPYAHVTFLARGFQGVPSELAMNRLLPSARLHGLVPSPTTPLTELAAGNNDTIGFGTRGLDLEQAPAHQRFAAKWSELQHALTHGTRPASPATQGQTSGAVIKPEPTFEYDQLYERSIWVVHLDPGVSLIPLARDEEHRKALIHFTDQRDPSALGFDEVTLTFHKGAFTEALGSLLGEQDQEHREKILHMLNAVNGRWTLSLLSGQANRRNEKLACVTAARYLHSFVRTEAEDFLWLLAGWEDFNRVTGSIGLPRDPSFENRGGGSDDIILFGLSRSETGRPILSLKLVEVKYGKKGANVAEGKQQIEKTYQNLSTYLAKDDGLAVQLFKGELARYILRKAETLYVHDIIDSSALGTLETMVDFLLEGDYDVVWQDHGGRLPARGFVTIVDPEAGTHEVGKQPGDIWTVRIPWALADKHLTRGASSDEGGTAPAATKLRGKQDVASEPPANPSRGTASQRATSEPDSEATVQHEEVEQRSLATPLPTPVAPAALDPAGQGWRSTLLAQIRHLHYELPEVNIEPFQAIDLHLRNIGVDVDPPEPEQIVVGPQATAIHLRLGKNTRVDKLRRDIETLKLKLGVVNDLSLSTHEVPGHVTLFVPHRERVPVPLVNYLGEREVEGLTLPIPAGIGPDNKVRWLDLTETNHLLVSGSTGSGKTVYLQGLILTLCASLSPRKLQVHLVDPKKLDFVFFADIPHMAGPILTSSEETLELLEQLKDEIQRRQEILQEARCRKLQDYHRKHPQDPLPYVVTVIDEYSQLMMGFDDKKQAAILEERICELAQLGRALGIYLVVATQRPSADIVSGRIKANFPTRISFRLPSHVDSQVILDEPGAENLLPGGDGLVVGTGEGTRRFQAFYVDDKTLEVLVELMKSMEEAGGELE